MRNLRKNKSLLCGILWLLLAALCGCSGRSELPQVSGENSAQPQITITTADQTTAADGAAEIRLDTQKGICRITQAGSYLLSGSMTGTVEVDAEEQIVHLILDNVSVESTEGPALQVLSAGKVILTLKEGTVNTFRDVPEYPSAGEADACIYSENDLTINGTGTLNVHGYHKDAVHTKDVLKVLGGKLFVQSKRDGLRGNDGLVLACEESTVQSEGNGLRTTKTGKPGKGNVEILGGSHSVIGGEYAISCASDLHVQDGTLHLMGVIADTEVGGQRYGEEEVVAP